MPKWLTTTLRLTAIVGVVSGASIVGLIAFRNMVDLTTIHDSGDAIGSYLQVLGGIYAVLLAFVVVVVWGQFNDARGFVHARPTRSSICTARRVACPMRHAT
jgi:hypothetical protein